MCMKTQAKKSELGRKPAGGREATERFRSTVPLRLPKGQFAPTPSEPVRQHVKMAGC